MSLLRAIASRFVTVDGLVFELRSVDAAALAEVGHAYLEGIQLAAAAADEQDAQRLAEDLRKAGESEEGVQRHMAAQREDARFRAMRLHAKAVSTPEGQAAWHERLSAYVRAAVVGAGRAVQPLDRVAPTLPAYELHAAGHRPPVEDWSAVRLVEADRPAPEDLEAAIEAHDAAGELPMWMLPADVLEVVGLVAAQLAGGRAASMLPFRVLAKDV